jgi:hypothetical protein
VPDFQPSRVNLPLQINGKGAADCGAAKGGKPQQGAVTGNFCWPPHAIARASPTLRQIGGTPSSHARVPGMASSGHGERLGICQ